MSHHGRAKNRYLVTVRPRLLPFQTLRALLESFQLAEEEEARIREKTTAKHPFQVEKSDSRGGRRLRLPNGGRSFPANVTETRNTEEELEENGNGSETTRANCQRVTFMNE